MMYSLEAQQEHYQRHDEINQQQKQQQAQKQQQQQQHGLQPHHFPPPPLQRQDPNQQQDVQMELRPQVLPSPAAGKGGGGVGAASVAEDGLGSEVDRIAVHVEVNVSPQCLLSFVDVHDRVTALLQTYSSYQVGTIPLQGSAGVDGDSSDDENGGASGEGGTGGCGDDGASPATDSDLSDLDKMILSAAIVDIGGGLSTVSFWQAELRVRVFSLSSDGAEQEVIDGCSDGEEVNACDQWLLPAEELQGLWESLVIEEEIKRQLLEYAATALLFSDKSVSRHVIAVNRVFMLHGPPGTGKTSLCKALAHKLSIRLNHRFGSTQLLEINAHSLFSKWFSESGKLVQKLFDHIRDQADDEDCLVCILIDEVESLAAARSSAMSGNEPSDAIRVVNAVLTQIDALSSRENVLILCTSNISKAIDLAFIDRADVKQYIGLPSCHARYVILRSCLDELMRVGIINPPRPVPEYSVAVAATTTTTTTTTAVEEYQSRPQPQQQHEQQQLLVAQYGSRLLYICEQGEGLSGRALRKLPFQAHAFFVQRASCSCGAFLDAMARAVDKEQAFRRKMEEDEDT